MKEDKTSDATDVLLTDAPPIPGRKQADDSIIAQTSKNMSEKYVGLFSRGRWTAAASSAK